MHPAGLAMIRVEITLSTLKLDAGRAPDDRFDPDDYARKLAAHLEPMLDDVQVELSAWAAEHGIDILVPAKIQGHTDMVDLLARRIIEAIRHFHERAPERVARRKPASFHAALYALGQFHIGW